MDIGGSRVAEEDGKNLLRMFSSGANKNQGETPPLMMNIVKLISSEMKW